MVDTVIIGTVALDSLETPFGKIQDALGGSACYASIAASFFSKPGIMSIIGKDFPDKHRHHRHLSRRQNIQVAGIL